jgi:hypothetical protein
VGTMFREVLIPALVEIPFARGRQGELFDLLTLDRLRSGFGLGARTSRGLSPLLFLSSRF